MKSSVFLATLAALVLGLTLSASARDLVLPAGTLLQCTLNEPNFSSSTVAIGDPLLCHLRSVTEFGQQAFPRGAYLVGHLEGAHDPGHFWGKGNLKLQFDRIGLPSGDVPLETKVIATRGYKVDREGDIRGKGHPKRDVVEWMLPPLWPWKVLMLPARGPRPALKGESVLTLRLMDDVQVPQVAQARAPLGPGWHYFGEPSSESSAPKFGERTAPLPVREITPIQDDTASAADPIYKDADQPVPETTYASFVTKEMPASGPTVVRSDTPRAVRTYATSPGTPVFILKSGRALEVGNYTYQDGRISYSLASGGTGVISTDEVDWNTTFHVNSERGVRVTLRSGHVAQGASGF